MENRKGKYIITLISDALKSITGLVQIKQKFILNLIDTELS